MVVLIILPLSVLHALKKYRIWIVDVHNPQVFLLVSILSMFKHFKADKNVKTIIYLRVKMDLRTDDSSWNPEIINEGSHICLWKYEVDKKKKSWKREGGQVRGQVASWERGHDWLKSVQKDCFLWPCAAISCPVIISSIWLGRCAEHAVIWRALLHAGCADEWSRAATESAG